MRQNCTKRACSFSLIMVFCSILHTLQYLKRGPATVSGLIEPTGIWTDRQTGTHTHTRALASTH